MPKNRYKVMRPFLSARGRLAPDMMAMTASAQASFDFSGENDLAEKLRVSLAIQPIVTALYANRPDRAGTRGISAELPHRGVGGDGSRALRILPFAFEPSFEEDPYRRYAEWALDVPMIFLRRGGACRETGPHVSVVLAEGLEGERATLSDWEDHLTTVFPEVRVKGVVEVRSADGCSRAREGAARVLEGHPLRPAGARLGVGCREVVHGPPSAARSCVRRAARRAGRAPDDRPIQEPRACSSMRPRAASAARTAAGNAGTTSACGLRRCSARAASGRSPADEALEERFVAGRARHGRAAPERFAGAAPRPGCRLSPDTRSAAPGGVPSPWLTRSAGGGAPRPSRVVAGVLVARGGVGGVSTAGGGEKPDGKTMLSDPARR